MIDMNVLWLFELVETLAYDIINKIMIKGYIA